MIVIKDVCKQVVDILAQNYPKSLFGFELDIDTDIYHIWYNQFHLMESDDFSKEVDDLLEDKFYKLGIFNVFVAYFFKYDPSNQIVCAMNKPSISITLDEYVRLPVIMDNCLIIDTGIQNPWLRQYKFNKTLSLPLFITENVQLGLISRASLDEPIKITDRGFSDHAEGFNGLITIFSTKLCKPTEENDCKTKECMNYLGVAA